MAKSKKSKHISPLPFVAVFILVGFIFLAIAVGFIVSFSLVRILDRKDLGNTKQACTMEAKLCPDGSYVGRTGVNCEFAPCSGSGY